VSAVDEPCSEIGIPVLEYALPHGACIVAPPEAAMNNIVLSTPKFGFIVATRAALGLGIGLLISRKLNDNKRRTVGRTLVTVGALATIPAALFIRRSFQTPRP
jgi:hypothetical protein